MPLLKEICNNIEYERILVGNRIYERYLQRSYVLSFCDGFIHTEVAKMLNCKVSTVKQRLERGKEAALCAVIWGRKQMIAENNFNRALREAVSSELSLMPFYTRQRIRIHFRMTFSARWISLTKAEQSRFWRMTSTVPKRIVVIWLRF